MKNSYIPTYSFEYFEMMNALPLLFFIVDMNARIQWCSIAMEKKFGYSLREMQQMGNTLFKNLMHPEDYPNALNARELFLSGEKVYISVCRLREKNKDAWPWFWSYARVYEKYEEEKVKTLLCFFREFPQKINTPELAMRAFHDLLYNYNKSAWQGINKRQKLSLSHCKKQAF